MKKILPLAVLVGFLSLFPMKLEEKEIYKENQWSKEVNLGYLEGALALNSIRGNKNISNHLNSFMSSENLNLKVDSSVYKREILLKDLVKKYSGRKFGKTHYSNKIFPVYVKLNDSLNSERQKIPVGTISFKKGELNFKDLEGRVILNKNETVDLFEDFRKVDSIKQVSENFDDSVEKRSYLYFSRLFRYIPLIKNNSKNKAEFLSILTLVTNESAGLPYLTGPSGDINLFQINPSVIPGIYSNLRREKSGSEIEKLAKSSTLSEFRQKIENDPRVSLLSGIYLFKELEGNSKSESQAVICYNLGYKNYLELPRNIRDKIESGKINSKEDINPEEQKRKGMDYLKSYYRKKEVYSKLVNSILN